MTSIIKGKTIPFTAERRASATDGTFLGMFDAESGTVIIMFSIRFASNAATTLPLWTIPSEYCPESQVTFPALVYAENGNLSAYYGRIETDGTVTQKATASCRQVFGMAVYKI